MADISIRQTAFKNAQDNHQTKPNDGGSINYILPGMKAANENHSDLTNNSVPSTQRGGAPVIQNPAALDPKAAANLSAADANLFNLDKVKRQPNEGQVADRISQTANDNEESLETELDDGSFDEQNLARLQAVLQQEEANTQQTLLQAQDAENINEDSIKDHKIEFPIMIIAICVVEWFGSLILNLIATVLGIFLFPVGMAILAGLQAWKIGFTTFIHVWTLTYEKKELMNFKKAFPKSQRIAKLIPKKKLGIKIFGWVGALPIINWLPTNAWWVYRTHKRMQKELK